MSKDIYERYIKNFDINLLDCKILGRGHNGIVYMLPEGKVIKICFEVKSCEKEYSLLYKIGNNKYFPRVYGMMGNYMIRDYVEGINLQSYIREYGLNKSLCIKILDLLEEFKALNFSKEDIRCKDIMIQKDGSLMVIDPKKFYSKNRTFPRHLIKGLYRLGVLNFFLLITKNERPHLYKQWKSQTEEYVSQNLMSNIKV